MVDQVLIMQKVYFMIDIPLRLKKKLLWISCIKKPDIVSYDVSFDLLTSEAISMCFRKSLAAWVIFDFSVNQAIF